MNAPIKGADDLAKFTKCDAFSGAAVEGMIEVRQEQGHTDVGRYAPKCHEIGLRFDQAPVHLWFATFSVLGCLCKRTEFLKPLAGGLAKIDNGCKLTRKASVDAILCPG